MAISVFTCPYCGATFKLSSLIGWDGTRRTGFGKDGMCPDCVYWNELAKRVGGELEVMNWAVFKPRVAEFGSPSPYGTVWAIRPNGELLKFCTLDEYYGEVPVTWRHLFKETLRQVPADIIGNKRGYRGQCNHKGCLDRLKCYWYDMSLENKPFNEIPEGLQENVERCPNYINKDKLQKIW